MAVGFTYDEATSILQSKITPETLVGLSTTTPDKYGGNFTEPSKSSGYSRQRFGTVNKSIEAQVANQNIIFLFEALTDCGSVTHVGLFKSETAVYPFLVARLTAALTVGTGYVPLIRANKLVIGLDREALSSYA